MLVHMVSGNRIAFVILVAYLTAEVFRQSVRFFENPISHCTHLSSELSQDWPDEVYVLDLDGRPQRQSAYIAVRTHGYDLGVFDHWFCSFLVQGSSWESFFSNSGMSMSLSCLYSFWISGGISVS